MKKFISNKGIGFYLLLVASILSFISAILFSTCREGKETLVIVLSVIAGIIALLVSFKRFKFTEYIPLILQSVSLGLILFTFLNLLADIFAKNNVIGISGGFITSFVFGAISTVLFAVSSCVKIEK